ncbi:MAG: replication protein C, partial [Oxalobacteraceae bacterium]
MAAAHSPGRGLRRFDEHAAKATKLVQEFCGLEAGMAPSNALAALKRAAPYMDVPLRVVSVIDLLFAWTKPQDWQGGQIPVVWPSNDLLAQKLGVTVRQVQKLLNQAQAFGLISFRDSPNGH